MTWTLVGTLPNGGTYLVPGFQTANDAATAGQGFISTGTFIEYDIRPGRPGDKLGGQEPN